MSSDSPKASVNNVLDFLLASFACAQEMDLYDAVRTATPAQMESVLNEYRSFASVRTVQAPLLSDGELRPYFTTESDLAPWVNGAFNMWISTFINPEGIWQAVDAIKYRLLYCHSLAVDDPLGTMMLYYQDNTRREPLLNYVNFLLHMGPLVRSHALCFVAPAGYFESVMQTIVRGGFESRLKEMLSGKSILQTLDFREIMHKAPEEIQQRWKDLLHSTSGEETLREANYDAAFKRIGKTIDAAVHAPGLLSVYLPFRYDIDLLSRYQQQALLDESISLPDADNWLLSRLIDIELPGIDTLSPDEVVNIRTQSEEFEHWRGVLRDAIQHADTIPANVLGRNVAIRREVQAKLREGKARLEASLPKSAVLKGLKKGTVSMLGGVISAAIVLLLDPTKSVGATLAAIAATAVSAGVATVAEASEGSSNQAKRAAWSHYVAMLQ